MFLSRKNQNGGRRLTTFPIRQEDDRLGYLLGYCKGCNEPLLMALQDREDLMAIFYCSDDGLEKIKKILTPKFSLGQRIIKWGVKWLNGKIMETPVYN